jgi:hypothetical protein
VLLRKVMKLVGSTSLAKAYTVLSLFKHCISTLGSTVVCRKIKTNGLKEISGENEAINRIYYCFYRTHYTIGCLHNATKLPE